MYGYCTAFCSPSLQSSDANLFAARSNRVLSFLLVEGYNPRIILSSEHLALQNLACLAALKMLLPWLKVEKCLLPFLLLHRLILIIQELYGGAFVSTFML